MPLADARLREVKPLSFIYEKERALPAEGKLVLFPPFWTHVHRGVTLQSGVKYIATTWVCFA